MKQIFNVSLTFIFLMNVYNGQSQNSTGVVDLNDLYDYLNQDVPDQVLSEKNPLEDDRLDNGIVTLGRVLFYDKNLSVNNTVSCGSCHKQEFAFGDNEIVSEGWNGEFTERHASKLINLHYATTDDVFWDARSVLNLQPLETISNPIEMGFSGTDGNPDINTLPSKLAELDYYAPLFELAFGDVTVDLSRISDALVQFIKSIVSFDSKYDAGLQAAGSAEVDFPNFTALENRGKKLVTDPDTGPGPGFNDVANDLLNCNACHLAPVFNTFPTGSNNGVIGVAGEPNGIDFSVIRSPSLREIINPNGTMNGPLMHDGSMPDLRTMINHYDSIPNNPQNDGLSFFLREGFDTPQPQVLNLAEDQKLAIEAFFKTLTGSHVYTNPKWSNPFNEDGTLTVLPRCDNNEAVSIVGLPATISDLEPIQLNGFPAGGVFSGPGVTFNFFNPSLVLPGYYEITYTYANGDGCTIQVSENIIVAEVSFNFVTYNLGTISPKILLDFEVLTDSNLPITVTNLNGGVLFNSDHWFNKGKQQLNINTYGWRKGIYLVKVGQQSQFEKVYIY